MSVCCHVPDSYNWVWHVTCKLQNTKSNARDTTNFTTKCLQIDMSSYIDITHKQLKHQITNSTLTFSINKSLIVDVLLPYKMLCQFVSI